MNDETKIRTVRRYATCREKKYIGGFPNFQQDKYTIHDSGTNTSEDIQVYGAVFLPEITVFEDRSIERSELSQNAASGFAERFRAIDEWATHHGYLGGFPNFEESASQLGALCIREDHTHTYVEKRDIPVNQLSDEAVSSVAGRFRAIDEWATHHGYLGGFPNFQQGPGVFGAVLIKDNNNTFSKENIPIDLLTSIDGFNYDSEFNKDQIETIRRNYIEAYLKIRSCPSITEEEKILLCQKFRKNITFSSLNDPHRNGRTSLNSDTIAINYEKLRAKGNNEFRQTIIHEFMHMVGLNHRQYLPIDQPGDGGEYYESPPLRAEICIAGEQSFTSGNRICKIENGYYVIEST